MHAKLNYEILDTQKMSFFSVSLNKHFQKRLRRQYILYGMFSCSLINAWSIKNSNWKKKIIFENVYQNLKVWYFMILFVLDKSKTIQAVPKIL